MSVVDETLIDDFEIEKNALMWDDMERALVESGLITITPPTPPVPVGAVIFSDDFIGPVGSKPNSTKWRAKTSKAGNGLGYWNGLNNCYLDGNSNLILKAVKRSDGLWNSCILSSIMAYGKYSVSSPPGYKGARYIECKARMARGAGAWSAPAWEWPNPYGQGLLEVDVNEQLGKQPGTYHFTLHNWLTKAQVSKPITTGLDLSAADHRYGCALYKDHADAYFDGVKKATIYAKDIGVADLTQYLSCLNIDLDMGGWGGTVSVPSPVIMSVDYAYVWVAS